MRRETRQLLIAVLSELTGNLESDYSGETDEYLLHVFRNALTVRTVDYSEDLLGKIDRVLQEVLEELELTNLDSLDWIEAEGSKVAVWNGDITKLSVEAIMNAANSALLGCFVKNHPCIDNQIHFWAGPRLREVCKQVMNEQKHPEETGKAKVTPGFNLPCNYVVHTVGPIAQYAGHEQPQALASSYNSVLDACVENGIKSIAFCCLSTGMFGYPNEPAAKVAIKTVRAWLQKNPGKVEKVVFNTFKDVDHRIYTRYLPQFMQLQINDSFIEGLPGNIRQSEVDTIHKWLHGADAVIVCAGAGMSANPGYDVYVNRADFKRHYPYMLKYGISTGYEAMGLFGNSEVPWPEKWRYQANHMMNMLHRFPINKEYGALLDILHQSQKEYFVITTNVDAKFEQAGFQKDRIYTPQGEWTYYQCMTPCQPTSVWESKPMLEQVLSGEVKVPKCPNCGGTVFGNVRGGDWFIHKQYGRAQKEFVQFVEELKARSAKVLILEFGAGFNTPTVSRFPMESIALDLAGNLVRVNPKDSELPRELKGQSLSLPTTAAVTHTLLKNRVDKEKWVVAEGEALKANVSCTSEHISHFYHHHGQFDWRKFLSFLS